MTKTSLHAFKAKIPDSWQTGWKAKACTSFVLYLKVFKNHLYYLWHVRVLSMKPCLHTQLPEHNKSYRKVSRGWGHLITWNGPIMGHLNSFSASGVGNLNKNFPKIQMPGGLPGRGMLKLRLDWYISLFDLDFQHFGWVHTYKLHLSVKLINVERISSTYQQLPL